MRTKRIKLPTDNRVSFRYRELMCDKGQSNSQLDYRRARIRFRAWHRGTREMDLILGQFVDRELKNLNENQLDELEHIMAHEDTDLLKWLIGKAPVPHALNTPLFRRIIDFKPDYHGI